MAEANAKLWDVDDYLAWANGREGRFELRDGAPVAMSPERALHALTNGQAFVALRSAVGRANLPCETFTDGMAVRVGARNAFEPDAMVVCPPLPLDAVILDNPVIAVEVLSPSTAAFDMSGKLEGYFTLPSLAHYLIIDPERRVLIHHRRGTTDAILTRVLRTGPLRLDPPGLDLTVEELFYAPRPTST